MLEFLTLFVVKIINFIYKNEEYYQDKTVSTSKDANCFLQLLIY